MTSILIGFFLVFLDYTISPAEGVYVEILPDVLGYLLIVFGAFRLRGDGFLYQALLVTALVMSAFSGLTYSQGLMGVELGTVQDILLSGVALAGSFLVAVFFLMALRQSEETHGANFGSKGVQDAILFMAVTTAVAFALQLLPVMGIIGIMIGVLGNLFFLFELGQSRNKYRMHQMKN